MRRFNGTLKFAHEDDTDAQMLPLCMFDFGGPGEDRMDTIESERLIAVPRILLRQRESTNIIIYVNDNGMRPDFCLDDYVIVDTKDKEIIDGKVYAISYNKRVLVRRAAVVQRGRVKFFCNERSIYDDIVISETDAEIVLGRAVSVMRRLF